MRRFSGATQAASCRSSPCGLTSVSLGFASLAIGTSVPSKALAKGRLLNSFRRKKHPSVREKVQEFQRTGAAANMDAIAGFAKKFAT
jgi:hypothetical protein